ncbi:hypothetical protein GCM10027569_51040 [Flindersiella endophytica]
MRQQSGLRQVGEHQPRTKDDRGVYVVAAGVAYAGPGGAVGNILLVGEAQGIDICP